MTEQQCKLLQGHRTDFIKPGVSNNAKSYKDALCKLRRATKNKQPIMRSPGGNLLHYNVHPRVATTGRDALAQKRGEEFCTIQIRVSICHYATFNSSAL